MNRRQWLWAGATAALAGGAGLGLGVYPLEPAAGDLGEDFWSLRFERPEGGELVLAAWRGQVLLINFWATWCPPCIRELPEFDRLHRARVAGGVQVLGLAVDSPTPVRQFLQKTPVGFAVGLAGLEGTDLTRRLGNVSGALPFTALIDRQGRLQQRKLGQTDFAELTRWLDQLQT